MRRFFWASVLFGVSACNNTSREVCVTSRVCDPPMPPSKRISVVCDDSPGSTCNLETLDNTVAEAVRHVLKRPESRVEFWTLGNDLASTYMVGSVTTRESPRKGLRAIEAFEERFLLDARTGFRAMFEAVQSQKKPLRRSPILNALGKLALSTENKRHWHIIVISDMLEFSEFGDWECAPPQDSAFRVAVNRRLPLTSNSLRGVRISVAYMEMGRIANSRCAVEIDHMRQVRKLWATVLYAAGARDVNFSASTPLLDEGE